MRHNYWHMDEVNPEHKLHKGQRFWRDGTPDEAEAIMKKRIMNHPPCCEAHAKELITWARNGDDGEFHKGWPFLDRQSE